VYGRGCPNNNRRYRTISTPRIAATNPLTFIDCNLSGLGTPPLVQITRTITLRLPLTRANMLMSCLLGHVKLAKESWPDWVENYPGEQGEARRTP